MPATSVDDDGNEIDDDTDDHYQELQTTAQRVGNSSNRPFLKQQMPSSIQSTFILQPSTKFPPSTVAATTLGEG